MIITRRAQHAPWRYSAEYAWQLRNLYTSGVDLVQLAPHAQRHPRQAIYWLFFPAQSASSRFTGRGRGRSRDGVGHLEASRSIRPFDLQPSDAGHRSAGRRPQRGSWMRLESEQAARSLLLEGSAMTTSVWTRLQAGPGATRWGRSDPSGDRLYLCCQARKARKNARWFKSACSLRVARARY